MKRLAVLTYALLIILPAGMKAQNNGETYGFWNLASVNGEARLGSMYRQKYTTIKDFSEFQESLYYSGGLKLNTRSYFWHPNFLRLELGGEYFPESATDDYVVTPDHSEVRTLKDLNVRATMFDTKPITLSSWADWNDSYQNRENLTNIRTKTRRLGASLGLRNRILPVNIVYRDLDWDQLETKTGRHYLTEQKNLEASTQKSFTERDRNELKYSHSNYFRSYDSIREYRTVNDMITMKNKISFDKEENYVFRSNIFNHRRAGDQDFNIISARESLSLELPAAFTFKGSYLYYNKKEEDIFSIQNRVNTALGHQLFRSLESTVYYEFSGLNHSYYTETRNTAGLNLNYTKKIPTGSLNLAYHYSILRHKMDGEEVSIPVYNEPYVLTDGEITTLLRPHVDENSVVVKDQSGTFIYQRNFDYILIDQGAYLEIQRVPGGQIPNGANVYIDYMALQAGSYSYDAYTNNISARINLFRRFLEVYYRGRYQDYRDVVKSDLLVLNYIRQNTVGGILRFWIAELGAEYEVHNSTITPYKQVRYFLNIQERFGKVVLSVNGNYRNYYMLDDELTRIYTDVSGRATYEFTSSTRISLLSSYRKQIGAGIDLDLLTASLEFKTRFRKLYVSTGLDLYQRDYIGDITNYYGAFIKLERRF